MLVLVVMATAAFVMVLLVVMMFVNGVVSTAVTGHNGGAGLNCSCNLRQFFNQAVRILSSDAQLLGGKGNGCLLNLRQGVKFCFNLGCAVGAVQILDNVYFPFHMYLLEV